MIIALTGKTKVSAVISILILNLIGFLNAIIYQFRGEVLLPTDLAAINTAISVSDSYRLILYPNMILAALSMMSCLFLTFYLPESASSTLKERRFWRRFGLIFSMIFLLSFHFMSLEKYYYAWWPEDNGYAFNVAMNLKMMKVSKPKGYQSEDVDELIEESINSSFYPDYSAVQAIQEFDSDATQPIILAIMNESFSDLLQVGNYETDVELTPNINRLKSEMLYGNLYTEVFGGGTCDSEYSFLTGNSTILFADNARAYELYVDPVNSSIAQNLKNQGYQTYAIHPDDPSNWNRSNVYPLLGFDAFYSVDDFENPTIIRDEFISDQDTYSMILNLIDQSVEPCFIFDVTVQNHGSYEQSYTNLDAVSLLNSSEDYPLTEQYLSLIRRSDEAYGELIEELKMLDRPVIVCFFGDHQPKIETSFYEAISGNVQADWSKVQQQNQMTTPFYIWANYDIPTGEIDALSINYLGALLTELSGTEMTPYQHYLSRLHQTFPVINRKGVLSSDQVFLSPDEFDEEERKIYQQYKDVLYNNIIDLKHRNAYLYTIETDE